MSKLFSQKEINQIEIKRRKFNAEIQRKSSSLNVYKSYIDFEKSVLNLEIKRLNKKRKISNEELKKIIQQSRIIVIYKKAISNNKNKMDVWTSYINFLKSNNLQEEVSGVYLKILKIHSNNPHVWVSAARWEYKMNNIPASRSIYKRGIRHFSINYKQSNSKSSLKSSSKMNNLAVNSNSNLNNLALNSGIFDFDSNMSNSASNPENFDSNMKNLALNSGNIDNFEDFWQAANKIAASENFNKSIGKEMALRESQKNQLSNFSNEMSNEEKLRKIWLSFFKMEMKNSMRQVSAQTSNQQVLELNKTPVLIFYHAMKSSSIDEKQFYSILEKLNQKQSPQQQQGKASLKMVKIIIKQYKVQRKH